jgi:uncharacterized DUF497 family protein
MLYNIEELIWDDWNREHIKKHKVSVDEVEESCSDPINSFRSYQDRLIVLGRTKENRLLTLILMKKEKGVYYLITARDMSRKERKMINEK